jgi:hypothetical protein
VSPFCGCAALISDAGNYTQHQETRFHKIIASRLFLG